MRARLLVLWLPLALACSREPSPPPPIVLVSIDTLRRDALRAFDPAAAPLPELDAFAAESVRFRGAVSTAPWTLPAHASLLTGLYPDRHGATDARVTLSDGVGTLAEALAARGYETAAFVAGGYLRSEFGLGRGFERYEDRSADAGAEPGPGASLFERAAAWLEARRDPRPLLLFLHTYALHDYFRLHPRAVARLAHAPEASPGDYLRCLQGSGPCGPDAWPTLRALYTAEMQALSEDFGRLRTALVASGAWEGAVVVLTSDHGEGFEPERGRIHHGGRLHEDQLRIPLLVRAPGVSPHEVETPVSLVDVMPTLLELAGAPVPPDLDGRSLVPWLRGGSNGAARPLFALEHFYSWWKGPMRMQARTVQARPLALAVIDGERWYLRSAAGEEIYDVAADPRQDHNLAARSRDLAALRALAAQRSGDRVATPALRGDDRLREQLEALGYAQ